MESNDHRAPVVAYVAAPIQRYGLSVVIVAAATLLRLAIDPLIHDQIPYFIYVAAVVVATWFCRADGGLAATIVAAFAGNYFFVEPRHQFVPHPQDAVAMSLFAAVAFGLVWLVDRWRRAELDLRERAERLRVLHEEAERASRLKDEFLATLSHELRTPLNAIVGWSHLLRDGGLPADRVGHAIDVITRNADAETRLVEDVLDMSRAINGKLRLEIRPVDLGAIVERAIDAIRPAANARAIRIDVACTARSLVHGDADRLQQVVWNLLSNAVKFTPRHGRVAVNVEDRDSLVHVTVTDTGIGIAADFLPHLFDRFSQEDASTTRRHGGLGLGLAIVRHLVELHGGTVTAASAGADRGASFVVKLPVRAVSAETPAQDRAAAAKAEPAPPAAPGLHGVRVLVVDDEQDARELIGVVLQRLGATVRTASSAREALEAIRAWRPTVLVADIGMPGEDGYALIKQVRALAPREGGLVPAGALTAYGSPEDRSRALKAGFQVHVAKPAAPDALAAAVAELAGLKDARCQ